MEGTMMAFARASVSGGISIAPCPSSWCQHISRRISLTFSVGVFQTAFVFTGPQSKQDHMKASKRGISVSYSPLGPPDVSPLGFQSQMSWELISLTQISGAGIPYVEYQPFTPTGETHVWWDLSVWCVTILRLFCFIFVSLCLLLILIWMWSLYSLLWREGHIIFISFW